MRAGSAALVVESEAFVPDGMASECRAQLARARSRQDVDRARNKPNG